MASGNVYSVETDMRHVQYPAVGIDEVGRGAFAGPLVVAAVLLDAPIEGLKDSKDIKSIARKEELAELIKKTAISWRISEVSASDIDEVGLTKAMELAVASAIDGIDGEARETIIDGKYPYVTDKNIRPIENADAFISAVMAASIIAKVHRDKLMRTHAEAHPQYGFDSNVGYGTAHHIKALEQLGPVNGIHRQKNVARVRKIIEHREKTQIVARNDNKAPVNPLLEAA